MDPNDNPATPAPEPAAPAPTADPHPAAPEEGGAAPAPAAEPNPAPSHKPAGENADTAQPAQDEGLSSMLSDESAKEGEGDGEAGKEEEGEPFTVDVPEGFIADKAAVDVLAAKVKDGSLSKEAAQELASAHMEAIQRYQAHLVANARKFIDAEEETIRSHPEYGGVNLEKSVQNAKLMLQKYGTPRLKADLERAGVLSHSDFFVMLNKLHGMVSDGESIGGAGQTGPEKTSGQVLFPDFK